MNIGGPQLIQGGLTVIQTYIQYILFLSMVLFIVVVSVMIVCEIYAISGVFAVYNSSKVEPVEAIRSIRR